MEPVEIDIRMKQNVTEESEKATGAMGEMDEAAKKMLDELKKMVADIESNLTKTASNISKTSDSLSGDTDKLKQASDILSESLEDAKKKITEIEASLSSGSLTIEDYTKASEELNQVGEELADVLTKSNDLQDISNELMKIGKGNINRLVRSKRLLAKANQWVAKTFKLSEAAAKRFTAILSFGLTIAISGLITLYEKYKEKQEEARLKAEELIKVEQEKRKEIADSYASEQAKIEAMRTALNSENVSRKEKLNIIKKLKAQIPGYIAELDAEGRLIRENKASIDQYLISLEKSLKLRAAEKELEEYYSKLYETDKKIHELNEEKSKYSNRPQKDESGREIFYMDGFEKNRELDDLIWNQRQGIISEINKVKSYINQSGLIQLSKSTGGSFGVETDKTTKEEYNAQKALADQLIDLRKKTAALTVDIMEEGLKKRLAQISLEEKQELDRIEEQQQKIVDTYNEKYDKKFKDIKEIPGIDPKTLSAIEAEKTKITDAAEKKRKQVNEENAKEIAALARKYADERVQIEYEYQQDIKRLEKEGNIEAANAARAERDKRISEISSSLIEETNLYKTATDEKLKLTKKLNDKLIRLAKERIQNDSTLTDEDKNKLITQIDQAGAQHAGKSILSLTKTINDLIAAKEKAKKAIEVGDVQGAVEAETEIQSLSDKLKKSGDEILNYYDQISSALLDIGDQLGLFTEEEKQAANEVLGMVAGAGQLAIGIASANPIDIITGSINLLTSAISFFDFKSKRIAKRQKEHKKNLDELARAYNNLQHEVDKALGTDVYDKQKKAIDNLRKQIAENERLIELELQKKKKKRDQDAIAGWRAEIDALKGEIGDITQSITDDLAQTNAKSLAQQLADALVTAARTGEDAFTAMGDVVNDVLRNAVVNSLSKQFLEKQMGEATEYLAGAMEDGELTEQEKQNFKDIIESAGRNFNAALAAYDELFAEQEEKAEEARRSAAKGIAQASQDSIDELAGTVTFMAGELRTMNVLAAARTESGKDTLITTRTILSVLNVISENTAYCRRLEDVVENLEKINRDGVYIKK